MVLSDRHSLTIVQVTFLHLSFAAFFFYQADGTDDWKYRLRTEAELKERERYGVSGEYDEDTEETG